MRWRVLLGLVVGAAVALALAGALLRKPLESDQGDGVRQCGTALVSRQGTGDDDGCVRAREHQRDLALLTGIGVSLWSVDVLAIAAAARTADLQKTAAGLG
jgi:hypothetical protein